MGTKQNEQRSVVIEVRANITERPVALKTIMAYAFTQGGALLGIQVLDGQGYATITIPMGTEAQSVRIVLGPEMEQASLTFAELLRRGGVDHVVGLRPDLEDLHPIIFDLGLDILRLWIPQFCIVRGTLLKRVTFGGVAQDWPVCNASIDIHEVDPWRLIIPKLPAIDIERLRDFVITPFPPRIFPVPPRPPTLLDIGVIDDPALHVSLNPQPLPPNLLHPETLFDVSLPHAHTIEPLRQLALPADLQIAALADRPIFERAILDNLTLLRPLLCALFPYLVKTTKIATVTTDDCGRFRAIIWRSFLNPDQSDLYFSAQQQVWPGVAVTITEPRPVVCNTWYDYQCGTEVTLYTSHQAAHACAPCPPVDAPNNWVLFMAIGNTSVWGLHGVNDATIVGAAGYDPEKRGLLNGIHPWGGTLRPRLEFDNSLRSTLGVYYYRVSFKKASEPETMWRPSTEAVNRHYTRKVGSALILEQYALGPKTVGTTAHLYEIPPALPPTGQWSIPNAVLDTQSAAIPTETVAPGVPFNAEGMPIGTDQGGLWQIKVELFDRAGAIVDPEALGIAWRVPASIDLTGTIYTQDARTLGLVDTARNYMAIDVLVDNNPTYARLDEPAIGASTAADICGVLNYASRADTVSIPFFALHRNRFANYTFRVQRGVRVVPGETVVPEYQVSGIAAESAATMSAAIPLAPGLPSVGGLLGECVVAGFTEYLYVNHLGTDGWRSLNQYDSLAVGALVLTPDSPVVVAPGA